MSSRYRVKAGLSRAGLPRDDRDPNAKIEVDPVWWTPLKLIFEVSDARLPNRLSAGVPATNG
jgi:hypothetical protein